MLSQLHLSLFIGSTQRVKLYSYPVRQKANVGVYATVLQGGTIRRGDVAMLE